MKLPIRRKVFAGKTPSVSGVEAYLMGHGWQKLDNRDPNRNVNVTIFHGPNDVYGKPIIVALPARADLSDAKPLLNAAVRTLSIVEAKSPLQIIKEMSGYEKGRRKVQIRTLSSKSQKVMPSVL